MGIGLFIIVILAALATIASGIWVAVALIAAIKRTESVAPPAGDAPAKDSLSA